MNGKKSTYYLWKDNRGIFYITDYKEINKEGKVNIDACGGYVEAKLVFSSGVKTELLAYAQKKQE